MHPGLLRTSLIHAFNTQQLNLDGEVSPGPLSSIAVSSKPPPEDYAQIVADAMCLYPWQEVYGLNFNQVMQLPFDEWMILNKRLVKRTPDQSVITLTAAIMLLNKTLFGITPTTPKDPS